MNCAHCGEQLRPEQSFCTTCGTPVRVEKYQATESVPGYSDRIKDPFFERYVRSSNRYARIFSVGLALAVFIGFAVYGSTTQEMDLSQAMLIGSVIALMFLTIGQLTIMSRQRDKTWDGIVTDKRKKRVQKSEGSADGSSRVSVIRYTVVIKEEKGREHELNADGDATVFNYYRVGDRVRFHGKLRTYEKQDKSRDEIIFCNACAYLNQLSEERCVKCDAPLLK